MRAVPRSSPRPTAVAPAGPTARRLAVLSVHTSPLDQPGTGDGGGLNVHVLETSRRLVERGIAIDVFTRATAAGQPPVRPVSPGLRIHHVPAGPLGPVDKRRLPNHLCSFLLGLESHVEEHASGPPFDVIHAHYWLSGWIGWRLSRRWGVPLVQSFHTLGRVKNDALAPGDEPEPAVRLLAEARLVDEADRVVVSVCGEARHLHRRHGLSGRRISVVPPGVDADTFRPAPARSPSAAPPGDGPLLLFVGRLQPLKGPDVAVRTLAAVRREVPDARLLIVGGESGSSGASTGPDALRALAADLGVADAIAIEPAQPQPAIADRYRAADVTVVPSRTESFGLVALESQACATPVVAADVGGLSDVVRGGVLVPGHAPEDHARAIVDLIRDDERRSALIQRGLRRARNASWERTVDGLVEVYDDLRRAVPRKAASSTGPVA